MAWVRFRSWIASNLHFRGTRVFNVIIEELLGKGMKSASNALLLGSSAGGLASILHCDKFKAVFPSSSRVKCFSDAGYFAHVYSTNQGCNGRFQDGDYANFLATIGWHCQSGWSAGGGSHGGHSHYPRNYGRNSHGKGSSSITVQVA
ncbi:hypothetical protein L1987_72452 [Smallanthus sonchifolius]|uniref:Uncharacterized protein n=1 Tax=Smallanthus sonchifolius TaxID=185202 RepID=A0ACB9AW62_9ASTR|nr:hypothetical protein L1987_72452 [Smallanthus sonchifolius]